jgi:hypothetical protein
MGSSNNWGIIHNQTKSQLVYILHHTELTAQEATITKQVGAQAAASATGPNGEINAKYTEEIKKISEKI